jgi:hypothetical protein
VGSDLQRDVLPIPDIPPVGLTTYDAKDPDTSYPPIVPLRPPAGAPNVLVVLIDDVGFGASSAFGGPCHTPNFERLAAGGLKYNRFHTTALCSPTRSALLTGRNHHSVGMGNIAELATSAPGNNSIWPNTAAPLAKILNLNGYSTAQFGKCHEVPVWETSPMGPYRQWPVGMGFELLAAQVHRDRELGRARRRPRRPQPHDRPGGPRQPGDGPAVGPECGAGAVSDSARSGEPVSAARVSRHAAPMASALSAAGCSRIVQVRYPPVPGVLSRGYARPRAVHARAVSTNGASGSASRQRSRRRVRESSSSAAM